MATETYEGWSNRQTWGVNLWLSNDEGCYRDIRGLAYEATTRPREERVSHLADEINQYVEDLMPDLGATLQSDLLTWALAEVDWFEIAKAWLEDASEESA